MEGSAGGALPDAAAGPIGGGGFEEAAQEEARCRRRQLKAQCVQHTVLHSQDLLLCVGVVRDVTELFHLHKTCGPVVAFLPPCLGKKREAGQNTGSNRIRCS